MRLRRAFAVAPFLMLTSACAGHASAPPRALAPACTIVTAADASKLFGGGAKLYNTDESASESVCKWQLRKDGEMQAVGVYQFKGRKYFQPVADAKHLRRIADDAYLYVWPDGKRIEFDARKGNDVVHIAFVEESLVKYGVELTDASDRAQDVLALGKIAARRL
jgi:hypothetical protein